MREYTITEYEMEDYEKAKNSMTTEDIVNHLKHIRRGYIGDYNFTGEEDDFDRYTLHIAISKAIDIIQGVETDVEQKAEWKISVEGYNPYCSACGSGADRMTKYCPECGARMK